MLLHREPGPPNWIRGVGRRSIRRARGDFRSVRPVVTRRRNPGWRVELVRADGTTERLPLARATEAEARAIAASVARQLDLPLG